MDHGFTIKYFKSLNFKVYYKQNIEDVYDKGLRNLQLRCRADLKALNMTVVLTNLETVVDECLRVGVYPVISWIHHKTEAFATE